MPAVSDDGKFVVARARSADNKDRWFVTLDPETGKTRVVDTLHDDAWIREAGGGLRRRRPSSSCPTTSASGSSPSATAGCTSTRSTSSARRAKPEQLTSGKWEITRAELSRDGRKFYITTTEVHPGERHLYTLPIDGGARTKITTMTGSNQAEVSPDDSTLGLVYSYSNKPPEVFLMPNTAGAPATQVTTTPTDEWRSFNWIDPKVITFKARDGVDVYARLFTPEMIGAQARPDAARRGLRPRRRLRCRTRTSTGRATSASTCSTTCSPSRGYVVLDVDYRASSGYGRDWRTAIYRHMGGKDLEDIVDGAKYLAATEQVDPKRIGVYGGSYGGFITLMAMFTTPDVFAAGAALRPVTDWAHYNHGYTSNILNSPAEGRRGVPQELADLFRRRAEGRAAHLPRHGRHQRASSRTRCGWRSG